jgi:hypothetical protein
MRKHRKLLAATLFAVLAITIVVLLAHEPEPRYNGRSLSSWLKAYAAIYETTGTTQTIPDVGEAVHAIQAIGTNALPLLLKWIQQEPPSWQQAAHRKLPKRLWNTAPARLLIDGPGYEKASHAMNAFDILGTNAAPAIPGLVKLMTGTTNRTIVARAIGALGGIGVPALPYLITALSNTNQPGRHLIPFRIQAIAADLGTNTWLPPLKAALQDPDPRVRASASAVLGDLAPDLLTNAPAQ